MRKRFVFIYLSFALSIVSGKTAMAIEEIILDPPALKGEMSLEETISLRRSHRNYSNTILSPHQISQLLWAGQGITSAKGSRGLRAAPSAGAAYPMELLMVNHDGVFRYVPERHAIQILHKSDLRKKLKDACYGQPFVDQVPVNMVICVDYARLTQRYGKRGVRYADMEAGHIAQNLHLEAVALGLGSVPVGAFNEDLVRTLCQLGPQWEPIYIIPVGYVKK